MTSESLEQNKKNFDDIKQNVVALLTQHKIPFEQWGTGSAKTLDHLIKEVAEGETILEVDKSGKLVRKVLIAYVDIYYTSPDGRRLKLVEDRQIFKDGRERKRILGGSIAEKLKATETPDQDMVHRAISEELCIETAVPIQPKGSCNRTEDSPSYPGLTLKSTNYFFEVELPDDQFKPEGYIEHQNDKDTYFVWKETK